ncbi:hypothetical protein D915_001288 [Fasciola hepatica]|uniref:Uncharacterized protein n=1 Tax=Fasciola hepatica TaxID=6192 RepID=A0A4E0RKM1_FASHE|nr:hypothetical protein D915_001288 [Fasciola hepatica]
MTSAAGRGTNIHNLSFPVWPMVTCHHVRALSSSCVLFTLLGLSIYVILLGLFATKQLRLLDPNSSDPIHIDSHAENAAVCRTFNLDEDFKNSADKTKIHPPKCHEYSLLPKRKPSNLYEVSITKGILRIRNRNASRASTTQNDQCSLFPIVRLDEYHSIYATPISSVRDGYQPQWPAFMVLCQPSDNLNHHSHIRWNDETLNEQERHFICGAFPPIRLNERSSHRGRMFNILLLGLDSISRIAAEHYLPKTMRWLRNHTSQVEMMNLYNIVGDGTTANLLALLTGLFEQELPESRKSHVTPKENPTESRETIIDSYPWIWDEFTRLGGYATHFIEDSPKWGTFQHRLTGFGISRTPTHSYGRPCLLMAAQEAQRFGKTLGCINSRFTHHVLLESMTEFFLAYQGRPRFSLTFLSEMIHEDPAYASILDYDITQLLDRIETEDTISSSIEGKNQTMPFANTLVVLFADHGPRMGPSRLSAQGKMEERLPLLSFFLPRQLIRAWPEARVALHRNNARLVTLFDVHATLRHLLHWQTTRGQYPKLEPSAHTNRSSHGSSLFVELPVNRDCTGAHIPPQWCTCLNWHPVHARLGWPARMFGPVWPKWVSRAAFAVVDRINRQIETAQRLDQIEVRCKKLRFRELISAEQALPSRELMRFVRSIDVDGRIPQYLQDGDQARENTVWSSDAQGPLSPLLRLHITASGLSDDMNHFEAVVQIQSGEHKHNQYRWTTINRLDAYESRAWCLPHSKWPEIRQFCIC